MSNPGRGLGLIIALTLLALPSAHGATYTVGPADNYQSVVDALQPGDTVLFAPGQYGWLGIKNIGAFSTVRSSLEPTDVQWIVLKAQDPKNKPVFRGRLNKNVIDFDGDCAYIKLINLEATNPDYATFACDGVKINSGSRVHHVVFEGLNIHNVGTVGFNTKGTSGTGTKYITVRYTEIAYPGRASGSNGECMYLGANDGTQPLTDSLIEYCLLYGPRFTGTLQGDGIDMKPGAARNEVRHNFIADTLYSSIWIHGSGSTDPADLCRYHGNVFYNPAQTSVRVQAGAEVYNNIIIMDIYSWYGFQISKTTGHAYDLFRDIRIYNNTIIDRGGVSGWAINEGDDFNSESTNRLYNNAFYSSPADSVSESGAADVRNNLFRTLGDMTLDMTSPHPGIDRPDYYPKSGSILVNEGGLLAPAVDFNGTARGASPDVGAYERTTSANPGWLPRYGFKGLDVSIATPRFSQMSGTASVTGTASGPNLKEVEVRFGGGEWQLASGTSSWTCSFDSTAYPDGALTVEARSYHEKTGGWAVFSVMDSVDVLVGNSPDAPMTLTLTDFEDTYLNSAAPSNSYGSNTYVYCQASGTSIRYQLFKVPSLGDIPAGSTVSSAKLRLYKAYLASTSTFSTVHLLNRDWTESDATWSSFTFPGDLSSAISTLNYSAVSGSWMEYDVTQYAQAVLAGDPNNGVAIVGNDYWYSYSYSKEYATYPDRRPYIELTLLLESPGSVPTVVANAATNVTASGARLNGQITATGGSNSTVTVYWDTSDKGSAPGTWANSAVLSGTYGATTFYRDVTGLSASTTYHFRFVATNATGSAQSSSLSFTTGASGSAPTVVANAATSITASGARLNGQITATGGSNSTVTVYWDTSDKGSAPGTWANSAILSGTYGATTFYRDVTGLSASTTYHFRFVATNATGSAQSSSLSFTTGASGSVPTVVANAATSITASGARLNGQITATGGSNSTVTVYWDTSDKGSAPGTWANIATVGSNLGVGAFYHDVTDLSASSTYCFRFVATNATGSAQSATVSFTTDSDGGGGSSGGGGCAAGAGAGTSAFAALLAGWFAAMTRRGS